MKSNTLFPTWAAFALIVLAAAACKKDDVDLTDPIPQILSVTINPTSVVEFQDSLVFTVAYRDGDGDLGENTPDAHNLYLTDNRIGITEEYRIRELAPQGAEIPITGNLKVVLRNTGITDNSNSQSFTYTLKLRDRAGHESEPFVTSAVTVHR